MHLFREARTGSGEPDGIDSFLNLYIPREARTGCTCAPWVRVKVRVTLTLLYELPYVYRNLNKRVNPNP